MLHTVCTFPRSRGRLQLPGQRQGEALMGADAPGIPQQLRLPVAPCAEHLPVASQRWAPSLPNTPGPLQTRLSERRAPRESAGSISAFLSEPGYSRGELSVCLCLTPLSQVQSSVSYQMWQAPGKQPQAFGWSLFQAQLGSIKLNNSSCNNWFLPHSSEIA